MPELAGDVLAVTALRKIQKLDELTLRLQRGLGGAERLLLMGACDALGELLGLKCTGVAEGNGFYDHSGGTCPIHEWFDPDEDGEEVEQMTDVIRHRATARYKGQTATVSVTDYDDNPGYLHVELIMDPPMRGLDRAVYHAHPKAPNPT